MDSRPSADEAELRGVRTIRRRRLCDGCGERATTFEYVGNDMPAALNKRQIAALSVPEVQALIGKLVAEGKL
ncbi:hypothetical protein D1012_08640 [Pseudotabrizicola alkalilacus]|uniref:Uncharacterized protein n=1 Tax=Pseudotabrizicola alkalilacus TaxID=2305252 RepID=A0A411Z4E1_9RHOB|nr:hypothetical protein D1012_08640 [Pseudotabrizicola alkalilacus]